MGIYQIRIHNTIITNIIYPFKASTLVYFPQFISRSNVFRDPPIAPNKLSPRFSTLDGASVADPGCLSRIPDPTFFHPGSRIRTVSIPDPGTASKNLSILTPKKPKKWVLSSRKYDPGCSSRIPDPDAGVKKAPDPGSWNWIRNTGRS
jgi:hypothetical protein